MTLSVLLVSGLAGAVLTRGLTRPIRDLIAGTRAIGEGDLSYRIAYTRKDEFADLARQFNVTVGRLEAQHRRLLEVQAGLEDEIARRTGELEDANARLQRLDQMRMLFLADIGHELRTPLTVLRGEAEVALRGERPIEEHRETLRRIGHLAQQMGRLVEDLLFLARAEVGTVRFEMQPLDLRDVIEVALAEARVLRGLARAVGAGGADRRALPCRGRRRAADPGLPDRARQRGEVFRSGRADRPDARPRDGEAAMTVRNVGPAIPKSDLPYVFNRFYRGRQPPNRPTTGSGLGLPIAKWIVDRHGGRIALSSSDCETLVTINLPFMP